MPWELRRNRDGTTRSTFYRRFQDKSGRLRCINLGVRIEGMAAERLHEVEDGVFELKNGAAIRSTALGEFPEAAWAAMNHRKHKSSEDYRDYVLATLRRFVLFLQESAPAVKEVAAASGKQVQAFMRSEAERGVSSELGMAASACSTRRSATLSRAPTPTRGF